MDVPYVGPRAFQRGEQLYGRKREVRDLQRLLIAERIVVFCSPSGAGKTSLIQAALIPDLERRRFRVLPVIRVNTGLEPKARSPINRYVLSTLLALEEGVDDTKRLSLEELAQMRLADYLDRRAPAEDEPADTVIIFDQFEEILTVEPTNVEAKHEFFAQVGEALENHQRWALFALREEFLAALDPYVRTIPNRLKDTFRLELLGVAAAKQAIQEPSKQAGVAFTDAAADALLDDLRQVQVQQPDDTLVAQLGQFVEPVQLQVVCLRLWQNLSPGTVEIGADDLAHVGDVDSALADYYAECVVAAAADTGVTERTIRTWVDEHLITEQGLRGQVMRGTKASEGLENAAIRHLTDAHLVRAEQRRGVTWFELAHDRLVAPVRQSNAAWREANLAPLQRQAALWQQQQRLDGLLLRGKELAAAEAWVAQHLDEITPIEQEFLAACQKAHALEQREWRNRRLIMIAAVVAFVFALVAMGAAWIAETQRRLAEAYTLAYRAESNLERDPELGLLLAIEAIAHDHNPLVEGVLRQAVCESLVRQRLEGHTGSIQHAAYSPNGQRIVSAGSDTTVRVWDAASGKTLLILEGHTDRVNSATYSPDGQRILTASADDTVRVWDAATGEMLLVLDGHGDDVQHAAFSPDGQRIVTASLDATARVWDAATGDELVQLVGHTGWLHDATFSPDGQQIVTASSDNTARLWHVQSGVLLQTLRGHERGVNRAVFSPDGKLVVTAGSDQTARVWDVTTTFTQTLLIQEHENIVNDAMFSHNGKHILTASWDGTARVWDATTGEQRLVLRGHSKNVTSATYRPDGQRIVTTSEDGSVRVWAALSGEEVRSLYGHAAAIWGVAFSPDGEHIVTASADGTARVWSARTGELLMTLSEHEGIVYRVAFSPDGKRIVTASADGTARVWNARTGEQMLVLGSHTDLVNDATFSPDGQYIVIASADHSVWDAATGTQIMILYEHQDSVNRAVFSSDGQYILTASLDHTARVWDATTGEEIQVLRHTDWVNDATYSHDGRFIVTASSDQTARIWNTQTGELLHVLREHQAGVTSAVFSPNRNFILTASWDDTVRLWDAASGSELVQLKQESTVHAVAFSPDGRLIVTAGEDGIARLFYTDVADVLALARQRATRTLTDEERALDMGE